MQPKIVLDTRTVITQGDNKGRYHVKIRVSIPVIRNGQKEWIAKRSKTSVYATKAEFKSLMGMPRSQALQEKKAVITELYTKAIGICKIQGLTPDQYITLMESSANFESVIGVFDWYIAKMSAEERDGNAIALRNARNSFVKFHGSDSLSFADVTVEWLNTYKKWMRTEQENTLTTVYMYCRALRTIMHKAHNPLKKITLESIPFGEFKIPSSKKKNRKVKLLLPINELLIEKNKILGHISTDPTCTRYLNYWKALYFSNGCNLADLAYLKIKDLHDNDIITFERKKTENTEDDNEPIIVYVGLELKAIIQEEGNKSLDPNAYLFPILTKGLSSLERKKTILQFIWLMNRALKKAAKDMELRIPLTSGTARYLMSTILRRQGIDLNAIRDMLGHGSSATTEHYADSFDIDLRKMIAGLLAK